MSNTVQGNAAHGAPARVAVPRVQHRLWLADQLTPNGAVFLGSTFLRLRGRLDTGALGRALTEIVTRHEVLRTSMSVRDGEVVGVLRSPAELRLTVEPVDPRGLDEAMRAEASTPLDVTGGLPVRARLLRLAPDDHVLCVTVHHLAFDRGSVRILYQELASFYGMFAAGGPAVGAGRSAPSGPIQPPGPPSPPGQPVGGPPPPPGRPTPPPGPTQPPGQPAWGAPAGGAPAVPALPRQFRDIAAEHDARHDAGELAPVVAQRRAALAGASPFELPPDRPRPPARGGEGALRHAFELPAATVERLTGVGRRRGATLFMVLLAACEILLYRYSGRADVTTGTSSSTRDPDSGAVIGPFLNMLVLPGDVSGNPTFAELVGRVRDLALDAYEGRLVAFDTLVTELGVERDPARTPLFQILVDFTIPVEPPALPGLRAEELRTPGAGSKYDLTIEFHHSGGGVGCTVEWDTALYETATVTRLMAHLRAVLDAVAENPRMRVDDVPMLSPPEVAELRALAAPRPPPEPAEVPARCLHELFSEQAGRTPGAVALWDSGQSLTYADLDRRSTAIAEGLTARGVGPDVPVGVLLDRSADLVTALLGILKAGGAYLPIDPETPPARVSGLLERAGAPLCVIPGERDETEADLAGARAAADAAGCLAVDVAVLIRAGGQAAPGAPSGSPAVRPDHLCAVYFTSGSTGEPKGVACSHRGWVSQMRNMQERYRLSPGDAVLMKTPISFDDVAREIFWPLMVGGRVVVLPAGLHRDPKAILEATIEHRVVWLQFVPSMLVLFLDEIAAEHRDALRHLRNVVSDGDRLRPGTVAAFFERLGAAGCRLHNHWGTTEVSIDSTHHVCGRADRDGEDAVALGRPMEGNSVHVLDHALRPVPRGAIGELCIGGTGLARGYLGDPGRTARAFVPHPWRTGERLYRTGDTGRLRPDGSLQYRGRGDHQVKVRGVRIELGEVEAAVRAFPEVADAVVSTWEPVPGDRRLVAYATPADGVAAANDGNGDAAAPLRARLRDFLVDRLAPSAVPSAILLLEELPRMPSGKVDRRSLPPPDPDALHDEPFVAPRTDTERALAEIWAEVLGATRLGANDDFFAAGGHSLLVTRAVNRMREAFAVDVPLRLVFEHPTVRSAAAQLEELIVAEIETMSDAEAERLAAAAAPQARGPKEAIDV